MQLDISLRLFYINNLMGKEGMELKESRGDLAKADCMRLLIIYEEKILSLLKKKNDGKGEKGFKTLGFEMKSKVGK